MSVYNLTVSEMRTILDSLGLAANNLLKHATKQTILNCITNRASELIEIENISLNNDPTLAGEIEASYADDVDYEDAEGWDDDFDEGFEDESDGKICFCGGRMDLEEFHAAGKKHESLDVMTYICPDCKFIADFVKG